MWGLYWIYMIPVGPLLEYFESVGPWRIQWSHQLPFDDLSHLISNFKIFKHRLSTLRTLSPSSHSHFDIPSTHVLLHPDRLRWLL
jgi:hypothetical protein